MFFKFRSPARPPQISKRYQTVLEIHIERSSNMFSASEISFLSDSILKGTKARNCLKRIIVLAFFKIFLTFIHHLLLSCKSFIYTRKAILINGSTFIMNNEILK